MVVVVTMLLTLWITVLILEFWDW